MQNRVLKYSILSSAVMVVAGCSSDSSVEEEVLPQVSELEVLNASESKLVRPGAETTEQVIKNGLLTGSANRFDQRGSCANCDVATAEAAVDSADGGSSDNFSGTTTQEQGVDESDRVKYDGSTLYVASTYSGVDYLATLSEEDAAVAELPHIRVLQRNEDNTLTQSAIISTHQDAGHIEDMYVQSDRLASLYNIYQSNQNVVEDAIVDAAIWYPYQNQYGLGFHDVSDKSQPRELISYTIDGYVLSSRRIGSKVYVVSSYSNYVQTTGLESEQELQTLYEALLADEEVKLLPDIEFNGETQPVVALDQCYLPAGTSENAGYSTVVTMLTFDLDAPQTYQAECVLAPIESFYASTDGLYFYSSYWDDTDTGDNEASQPKTVLHHFTYTDDSIAYQATGKLNGGLGWHNSHLRFSEKDGYLRVVTTGNGFDHKLFVLQSDSTNQSLNVVSHLPNDLNPAEIGKPGEDIYAIRYFGDKAYIVTFERRDPLYVIDLNNPLNPVIEGELDIPGYSAYLQPLNENFILGVGQQVDPNLFNGEVTDTQTQIEEGAKIELYDVSNPELPVVAATIVFPDKYSTVEWDYHALTYLQLDQDTFRFALPISGWDKEPEEGGWVWNYVNEMKLINVDLSSSEKMSEQGGLSVDTAYDGSWGDRAVLHDDLVYYIRNNQVWQSLWSNPSLLNGPF